MDEVLSGCGAGVVWASMGEDGLRYTATDTWGLGTAADISLKTDDWDEVQLCWRQAELLGWMPIFHGA